MFKVLLNLKILFKNNLFKERTKIKQMSSWKKNQAIYTKT